MSDDATKAATAAPQPEKPAEVRVAVTQEREIEFDPEALGVDLSTLSPDDLDGMTVEQLEELHDRSVQADTERERHDKEQDRLRAVVLETLKRKRAERRKQWEEDDARMAEREKALLSYKGGSGSEFAVNLPTGMRGAAANHLYAFAFAAVLLLGGGGVLLGSTISGDITVSQEQTMNVIQADELGAVLIEDLPDGRPGDWDLLDPVTQAWLEERGVKPPEGE